MRVKRGTTKKRKHKKVLKAAKGYQLTYSKLYRRAKEALLHAGKYSYDHRKKRRAQMRKIWIKRINGALTQHDMKYSEFIHKLSEKKVEVNRKMLAEIAVNNPEAFGQIVETIK